MYNYNYKNDLTKINQNRPPYGIMKYDEGNNIAYIADNKSIFVEKETGIIIKTLLIDKENPLNNRIMKECEIKEFVNLLKGE